MMDFVQKDREDDGHRKEKGDFIQIDGKSIPEHVIKVRIVEQAVKMLKAHPFAQRDRLDRVASEENIVVLKRKRNAIQRKKLVDNQEKQTRNEHQVERPFVAEISPALFDHLSQLLQMTFHRCHHSIPSFPPVVFILSLFCRIL